MSAASSGRGGVSAARGRGATGRGVGTPPRRHRRWWLIILLTLLGLLVLLAAAIGIAYARTEIPDPKAAAEAQVSIVYFSDGKTEMGRINSASNRESVPLSKVPKKVQQAFLAAEDRTFYTNNGVSVSGIARAIKVSLEGGETQGGSTITQQYVKNTFLTSDQTMTRKIKEIFISIKLDQQESKDQILENYLNTIYFGRGAFGIQTAAHAYFDKDVSALTPSEGAVLASVIRGPSIYDPAEGKNNAARLTQRIDYIRDGMVKMGWLTTAEAAQIKLPTFTTKKLQSTVGGTNGYLVAMAKAEISSSLGLDEGQLAVGGLRVTTTIDQSDQAAMVRAVQRYLPDVSGVQVGLAAVEPGTGAIKAIYGGEDYLKRQLNNASQATMQGGSTFKAFTLAAAVEQGISTKSYISGASPVEAGGATIPNEFDQQFGMIPLRYALAKSVNTAFVRLNERIGPEATKKAAIAAGIPDTKAVNLEDNVANTLGTATPHVLDEANAYATFAAEGKRATPHIVAKATSVDGAVDYTASTKTTQAFSADVAADVTEALTHVVTEGTGTRAQRLGRPVAGKTGTTDENKSVWFTGFVPQLATSCGMYREDDKGNPIQIASGAAGSTYCLPIWTNFMINALENVEVKDFPQRAGIGDNSVYVPRSARTQTAAPTGGGTAGTGSTSSPTSGGGTPTGGATTTTSAPAPTTPPAQTQQPTPTQQGNGGGAGNGGTSNALAPAAKATDQAKAAAQGNTQPTGNGTG